jgi:hypothetical protein
VGFLEQLRQSADELAHWAAEAGKVGVARLEELAARRRVGAVQEAERRAEAAARHAEEVARAAMDGRP